MNTLIVRCHQEIGTSATIWALAGPLMTGPANKTAQLKEMKLAKAKEKKAARNLYTAADIKLLKQYSKARTPVFRISKEMKRTVGSLKQKAQRLVIGLGHQR